MDAKKINKTLLSEDGQGLVEFFFFLPFMLMMYSVCLSLASSINSSINQQKVTRGYFYYIMQNNSMIPTPRRDGERPENSWNNFGMHINVWGEEYLQGTDTPKATCFRFNVPLGLAEQDSCEKAYRERTTQFIRVSTAYGVCGATYNNQNGRFMRYPNPLSTIGVISAFSCQIE